MAKLWLDDLRDPPDDTWLWAKSSYEAFAIFAKHMKEEEGYITHISFDHDLGEDDTVMPVTKYLETLAFYGAYPRISWAVHSMNPVGRDNIVLALEQADKYWQEHEK